MTCIAIEHSAPQHFRRVLSALTKLAGRDLNVCKSSLQPVEEARRIAGELLKQESRGTGDTENAMRRIEARYGVPYGLQWALRYRPPKDIVVSAWTRLLVAYEAECERIERKAALERERIRILRNATDPSLARAGGGVGTEEVA